MSTGALALFISAGMGLLFILYVHLSERKK